MIEMFNTKGLMSSMTDEWRTPQSLFNQLDKEFNFDSDPCPANGYSLKEGIIKGVWLKKVFVNPPYSKIKDWVSQGYTYGHNGNVVVMLIPSRTDTRWWHDYVMKADEIRFIKGRLKFNDGKGSAPFPSVVVIFRGSSHKKK